jgi:succinate dehydrogenase / fumarate reductase, cytochrome b subunit
METPAVRRQPSVVDRLNLGWLLKLLSSSIGRKFVMGVTGLLLCGFLVGHLAGNLLLYSGQAEFDRYAHKLHEWELLPLVEAGLLGLFLVHIYLAVVTTRESRQARAQRYAVKESKQGHQIVSPPAHNWMFISGAVVLGFLLWHLADLRVGVRGFGDAEKSPFLTTIAALSDPASRVIYVIGTLVLGLHLSHGFSSAFRSLGLAHPKYNPLIKAVGIVFAAVIAAGFCSMPILVPHLPHVAAAKQASPQTAPDVSKPEGTAHP